jgi:hypothetical protein
MLACKASFGVLVYHTSIWFFFFISKQLFLMKIGNGPIFWKWKYDKWQYMWSVNEGCNVGRMFSRMWNKPMFSNIKHPKSKKWRKSNEKKT